MAKSNPIVSDLRWKLEVQGSLLRLAKISTYLAAAVTKLKDGSKVENDIIENLDKSVEEYLDSVQGVMDILEKRIKELENE